MTVPWTQAPNVAWSEAVWRVSQRLRPGRHWLSRHSVERRPYLGGRASSYEHPGTGKIVDNCQHVLLGCCTNLIEFYRRLGVQDKIRWYERLTFLEPGAGLDHRPSSLPAPFHTAPSFLSAACLNLHDKLSIAGAMAVLAPMSHESGRVLLAWLRRHGQTEEPFSASGKRCWSVR